jgi:hypothetical protein
MIPDPNPGAHNLVFFSWADASVTKSRSPMKKTAAIKLLSGAFRLFPSSPLRDCVVTSKTSSLSFRPQGEILDPSHSFGMTTRSWAIATQSPAGEDKGGAGLFPSHLHPVPSNALRTGLSPSSGKERCRMCTNVKITLCIVSRQNACSLIFHVTTHSTFLPSFCATPMKCRPFRGSVPSSDRDASHR